MKLRHGDFDDVKSRDREIGSGDVIHVSDVIATYGQEATYPIESDAYRRLQDQINRFDRWQPRRSVWMAKADLAARGRTHKVAVRRLGEG